MSVWTKTVVMGLYTLSPTHVGTGQATGAVDLPIARDVATGFPVLPATGLKGVLRDRVKLDDEARKTLFGKELGGEEDEGGLTPGLLAFTEGRLLAWPVRSLRSSPFLHVTCPLILERLARDLRATGAALPGQEALDIQVGGGVFVADPGLADKPLVLEDLIFKAEEVRHHEGVQAVAAVLAKLVPEEENPTRDRLAKGLVILPDVEFMALMQSSVPVCARVKLTGGKTTDTWYNEDKQKTESGNLWYEEFLPADCLFVALVGQRPLKTAQGAATIDTLLAGAADVAVLQIGGNETVGQGLTLCTLLATGRA